MAKRQDSGRSEETRPAVVEGRAPVLYGRYYPPKVEGLDGIKATFPLDTVGGKAALINSGSPGNLVIGTDGRLRLRVCDALCYWDTHIDENTGEISEFVRTVFYTPEGDTFKTTSPHAPHFVARLVDVFGLGTLRDGVPVTISERKSPKSQRVYHDFRLEIEGK